MCQGLGGGGAQPHGVARPNEGNVKPERDPVHGPGLQHVELDGDLDPVEVGLVSCLEVDDVTQGLRGADVDVKVSTMGCLKYSVRAALLRDERFTPWKYS